MTLDICGGKIYKCLPLCFSSFPLKRVCPLMHGDQMLSCQVSSLVNREHAEWPECHEVLLAI